jgi:hypothetical protein
MKYVRYYYRQFGQQCALTGLAQPQVWDAGDVCMSGDLAGETRARQRHSFERMPENVRALEGLPCRKRVASASSTRCARPSRACFGHKAVKADHI